MSIILDALKKSDAERQRQNAPGIASIPTGRSGKSTGRWIWIIGVLLLLNLVAVVFLIKRPGDAPSAAAMPAAGPAPASTLPVPAPAAAGAPTIQVAAEPATAGQVAEEPVTAGRVARPDPAPRQETALAATLPGPGTGPATATAQARTEPPAPRPTVTDGLPTFDELRARGVLQLPDLHVDIHVYSGNTDDRFVFINMSKYKERARLAEGPFISEITPDGVVLDYLGTAFLLPRE